MEKIKMSAIRKQFPMYANVSDQDLLIGLKRKYYADVPGFYNSIDFDTERDRLNKEQLDESGPIENFLAGAGKTYADIGRAAKRVGNMVGIGEYDQKAAQEDADLDAPLMDTTAGSVGKFVGDVVVGAPLGLGAASAATRGGIAAGKALAKPGAGVLRRTLGGAVETASPYAAAIGTGAVEGAALSPEDMGKGAGMGAAFGAGGETLGRVGTGLYQGGKAALEPLYEEGRKRILKRTLDRFATDRDAVLKAADNPEVFVPGANPTLAQATGDAGIAQLERGAGTLKSVADELDAAKSERVGAYKTALDELAGNDGRREFFEAAREANAKENFGRFRATPLEVTPEIVETSAALAKRDSIQSAMEQARALAREKGISLGDDPAGSAAGLEFMKRALDDQIKAANLAGKGELARAIKDTQDELVGMLQTASPDYGKAVAQYAEDSRPINQMAIGKVLRDTLTPALGDFNKDLNRTRANQYAGLFRDPDKLAQEATGLRSATLKGTLDPAQLATAEGIAKDAARATVAEEAGKSIGSPTAQYLGAQNVLRQTLGPLGLPQGAFDTTLSRVASSLLSLPFKLTQSQTEEMLGQALRDPKFAAALMRGEDPATWIERYARPYAAQAGIQLGTE